MAKITNLRFENLKGITAEHTLTGKDIFFGPTGVGKTARMQAVTIGVLGYDPSIGKRPMDTIKIASGDTMKISVSTDTGFSIERMFAKNPVSHEINISPNYGERGLNKCEARITQEMGDFPVMWNLGEFLNLSDAEKRRFIFNLIKIEETKWSKEGILEQLEINGIPSLWVDKIGDCWKGEQSVQQALTNILFFLKDQQSLWRKRADDEQGAVRRLADLKNQLNGVTSTSIADIKHTIETIIEKLAKIREQIAQGQERLRNTQQRDSRIAELEKKITMSNVNTTNVDTTNDINISEAINQKKQLIEAIKTRTAEITAKLTKTISYMDLETLKQKTSQKICPFSTMKKRITCKQDFTLLLKEMQDEFIAMKPLNKEAESNGNEIKRLFQEISNLEHRKLIEAYKEELRVLKNQERVTGEIVDINTLNQQRTGLEFQLTEKKKELDQKEEIKRNIAIVNDLLLGHEESIQNIEVIKRLLKLLGPKGIQGEIVKEVIAPIFDKANSLISQIDNSMNINTKLYNDDKQQEIFEIGWEKGDKWISFDTLSSGQKVIFSIALMVALILTRNPACKILGIELGECDTYSATMLLAGLDKIADQLDNILVCSWHKFDVPEGWQLWNLTNNN